jgi:hypothetical protein
MQTVSEFAESVGYTPQAVNAKIRKLELILEPNPKDNRGRILSPAQSELLREYFPAKPGATAPVNQTPPPAYVEYQRPTEIGLVLAERSVSVGEIVYEMPTNSPVLQLMQQRLGDRRSLNDANLARLQSFNTANAETAAAIDSIQDLDAISSGEEQADRLFFLQQEAFRRRTEALQLAQLQYQSSPKPQQPQPQAPSSGKSASSPYEGQQMPF